MSNFIVLPFETAESVRIDGICYRKVRDQDSNPVYGIIDTESEVIDDSFSNCTDCLGTTNTSCATTTNPCPFCHQVGEQTFLRYRVMLRGVTYSPAAAENLNLRRFTLSQFDSDACLWTDAPYNAPEAQVFWYPHSPDGGKTILMALEVWDSKGQCVFRNKNVASPCDVEYGAILSSSSGINPCIDNEITSADLHKTCIGPNGNGNIVVAHGGTAEVTACPPAIEVP